MQKRLKILRKLNDRLSKEGHQHWLPILLVRIFIPCMKHYQRQSHMKYNLLTDTYTIKGKEYHQSFLDHLHKLAKDKTVVRVIDNGDQLLFEFARKTQFGYSYYFDSDVDISMYRTGEHPEDVDIKSKAIEAAQIDSELTEAAKAIHNYFNNENTPFSALLNNLGVNAERQGKITKEESLEPNIEIVGQARAKGNFNRSISLAHDFKMKKSGVVYKEGKEGFGYHVGVDPYETKEVLKSSSINLYYSTEMQEALDFLSPLEHELNSSLMIVQLAYEETIREIDNTLAAIQRLTIPIK